jgi:hypothetical protein
MSREACGEPMSEDRYLIWSHEHHGWWGPGSCGYPKRLSEAGRYTREQALRICTGAMAGEVRSLGAFPELPVREADLLEAIEAYPYAFGLERAL